MFMRMCVVFVGVSSFVSSVALAQPERFVDRASEHPVAEGARVAAPKKQQAVKTKVSRLTQEANSDEDATKAPVKKRIGTRAPNGLR